VNFADLPIEEQATIDAQIFFKYERHLKHLSLQEVRLRRMYEKDLARLRALQAERKEAEAVQAAAKPPATKPAPAPLVNNPEIGFEFAHSPRATDPRASAA
jgi:hypothetical protein